MGKNLCKAVGVETVRIRMHDNVVRKLTDDRHVLDLRKKTYILVDSNKCKYIVEGGA